MTECCATCDRFMLEPGKQRSGVCFAHWMPYAVYDDPDLQLHIIGGYGRVFPWFWCLDWVEQGSLPRLEPMGVDMEEATV